MQRKNLTVKAEWTIEELRLNLQNIFKNINFNADSQGATNQNKHKVKTQTDDKSTSTIAKMVTYSAKKQFEAHK